MIFKLTILLSVIIICYYDFNYICVIPELFIGSLTCVIISVNDINIKEGPLVRSNTIENINCLI